MERFKYTNKVIEEIKFDFSGKYPELSKIEDLVEDYCEMHQID